MKAVYFINTTILLSLNILVANSHAAERKVCTNPASNICLAAEECNDWYRYDLEPDEANKSFFEKEVETSGNEEIMKSCTWKVGFVSASGATIYVREDEL